MIWKSTFAATTIKLATAAILGVTVMATSAQAEVITFQDQAEYGATVGGDVIVTGNYAVGFYSPFTDGTGSLVGTFFTPGFADCTDMACPVNNQTTYYGALNDGYVDIVSLDGSLFSVDAFDASFIGGTAALTGYPAVSGLLRIQGWFADGSSVYETYQLAGPGAAGFSFAHYESTAAFSSFQFTEIAIFGFTCNTAGSCNAFSSDRGQFALDNLALVEAAAAVPEPASLALFGLGLAGFCAGARRKKASKKA